MRNVLCLMAAAGLGAGVMFLFDPRLGRQRRDWLRDQLGRAAWQSGRQKSAGPSGVSGYGQQSMHPRLRVQNLF